jgi:hypothetical protein
VQLFCLLLYIFCSDKFFVVKSLGGYLDEVYNLDDVVEIRKAGRPKKEKPVEVPVTGKRVPVAKVPVVRVTLAELAELQKEDEKQLKEKQLSGSG